MVKMMTQMDLLTKHFMGSGSKSVNAVSTNNGVNPDEVQFDAMYNEEVQFLSNQEGGSRPSYQRPGENQRWNRDRGNGWRDRDREWSDRGTNWRDRDGDKYRYVPPHERQKSKEPRADPESFWTEDMLSRILNKVEGSEKVLKEMKDEVSSLNQTVTPHSVSIKQLEIQMGQISVHLNPRPKGGLSSDTLVNPKNDA
ncbi:hypothetical protein MTR67_026668 [Solanum verrucosum]|uniref:Integrase core domain containing protein n=1 Tax=Solanum verrucosum TaxID=315347 RepID=A0AAF0R271_SOLVR|nr:hypothetical protein MTR67_026668 [Solanum verrucosum]